MARRDPHSYADATQARTEQVDLVLSVDFEARRLRGTAALTFATPSGGGPLDLDTRDLSVESVTDLDGKALQHMLDKPEPILGARLRIALPAGARGVRIAYATSSSATALQWLAPEQTAGGANPFLYTQCQPIHARSIAPLQDTPALRVRWTANFSVPPRLRALAAATSIGRSFDAAGNAVDRFEMHQPVPPYLIAFAVGDLAVRQVSARSAVWAERPVVEAAAWEFDGLEGMLEAAEELFGPYDWERADLLVLPPSFPYGGMENPRLTFLTPSVIAGDRSLVNVVAHELAHSWSGNLVTNANAEHFWLNEGLTVYAERRILEALEGTERAELHAAIGHHELLSALQRFADRPALTKLRTQLAGVDPDEAYSAVPYEKGYLFLRRLEEVSGRERFDEFLRVYLEHHRFRSVDTDEFLAVLEDGLPGAAAAANAAAWIDQPGLPVDAPVPRSDRLAVLQSMARAAGKGMIPDEGQGAALDATELLVVIQALPPSMSAATCAAFEQAFHLDGRRSLELRAAWARVGLRAKSPGARDEAVAVLRSTGRMKYLRPLYAELAGQPETQPLARQVYAEARPLYHPIARAMVESLLAAPHS